MEVEIIVKKMVFVVLMVMVLTGLLSGCNEGSGNATPATTDKMEAKSEAIPTLDQVISGTWKLYAGYDQSGNLDYTIADSVDYSFTFNADNGFSGVYRQSDGYLNASFKGTYDVSDSKLADKNPYKWYFISKIDKGSIVDSGQSTLLGNLGGDHGLNLIFKFRELDGKKVLYEEMQRLYYAK